MNAVSRRLEFARDGENVKYTPHAKQRPLLNFKILHQLTGFMVYEYSSIAVGARCSIEAARLLAGVHVGLRAGRFQQECALCVGA